MPYFITHFLYPYKKVHISFITLSMNSKRLASTSSTLPGQLRLHNLLSQNNCSEIRFHILRLQYVYSYATHTIKYSANNNEIQINHMFYNKKRKLLQFTHICLFTTNCTYDVVPVGIY